MDIVYSYPSRLKDMTVIVDGKIYTRHVYLFSRFEGVILFYRQLIKVTKHVQPGVYIAHPNMHFDIDPKLEETFPHLFA